MKSLFGSHYFLSAYPLYVYALIFVFGYLLLLIGRWVFEGKAYNVAFSASLGDAALTGFLVIAAWMIQQQKFIPTDWMENITFHYILICISTLSSIIYFLISTPKQVMDKFHAFAIVPFFTYFILSTIPIYILYGNLMKIVIGFLLLLFWLILVIYDGKKERLDQRKWISKNHPEWKFKK